MRGRLNLFHGCLLLAALALPAAARAEPLQFNRDIRPILADACFACHGPDKAKRPTEMRLDTFEGATTDLGGYFGIVPGKPEESEMYKRLVTDNADERMPPADFNRTLTPGQIETIKRWIEQGAPYEKHWAFIPPQRPPLSDVKLADWSRQPIDRFILARLEQEGLAPSAEASKETFIRRVTMELTGLPPTLDEVDAFLADESPDAYERLVDRLLASPRYGERMVLEWLDAARYADSNGYQTDGTRAMWPWRDWVVRAMNANMPFDQFTIEQLAGDLLPNATIDQKIATGFNRNHMLNGEGGAIAEESRVEYVVNRVDTTATVWLGLTIGCARCHDHKYDPITQREFYELSTFFNTISESGGVDRRNATAAPTLELPTEEQTARINELQAKVNELESQLKTKTEQLIALQPEWEKTLDASKLETELQEIVKLEASARTTEQAKKLTDHYLSQNAERQELQKQLDATKKSLNDVRNSVLITMIMEEQPKPRDTFILIRGEYDKHGEQVSYGTPATLPPLPETETVNRLTLARWLVDGNHPLTSRVTVNRQWQQFFGTGLVKTAEDFGVQSEVPSHPELLDWLAVEFASDWDVKRLQRLLVTSSTYRQSSQTTPELLERDPENRLLARAPRLRHSSLILRDQALAVSGLLTGRMGGPPVKPYQPDRVWEDFSFDQIKYTQDHGEALYRRSLYVFWRRSVGPTTMFDTATRQTCQVRVPRTNTPLHSLILLNDPAYVEAARALGERAIKEGGNSPEERIAFLVRVLTSRKVAQREMELLLQSLERVQRQFAADRESAEKLVTVGESPRDASIDVVEHASYAALANLLLNLDEVLNKE